MKRQEFIGCAAAMLAVMALVGCQHVVREGAWDANVADFARLSGETDDAPRIRRAIEAAGKNGIAYIPRGEYEIATPLVVTNRCSLELHPAAVLRAVAKMDFVLTWDGCGDYHSLTLFDPDGRVYDNCGLFIRGGDIDGRGLASCLRIGNAHHFTLADITLHNGAKKGLEVSRWNGGHLYELIANNVYCKCNMKGLAGNMGIDLSVWDCHLTDIVVVDYTIGIRVGSAGGSSRFTRCHVWGGTVPPKGMGLAEWGFYYGANKRKRAEGKWTKADESDLLAKGVPEMLENSIAFDVQGGENVFDGCYADTATIGYNVPHGSIITHSGFFNNPLMGLRKSTCIVHKGGPLTVSNCEFVGGAGCEKLFEGTTENVRWLNVIARGGADMAAEERKLSDAGSQVSPR